MKKILTFSTSIAVALVAASYSFGQQNNVFDNSLSYSKSVSTLIGAGLDRPGYEKQDAEPQELATQVDPQAIDAQPVVTPAAEGCAPNVCNTGTCGQRFCTVPNMIGDLGLRSPGLLVDTGGGTGWTGRSFTPGYGRRFKISDNNSPVPQSRVYFNYGYLKDSEFFQDGSGNRTNFNTRVADFGAEWAFLNGNASVQMNVPVFNAMDTGIDLTTGPTSLHSTDLGNIGFALKGLIARGPRGSLSVGIAVDTPTANDTSFIDQAGDFYQISNDVWSVAPFVGWQWTPNNRFFMQGFFDIMAPTNDGQLLIQQNAPVALVDTTVPRQSEAHVDLGTGFWLRRDNCGNGICFLSEWHYTAASFSPFTSPNAATNTSYTRTRIDALNWTLGLGIHRNRWEITPAIAFPLKDSPDRYSNATAILQINRRF